MRNREKNGETGGKEAKMVEGGEDMEEMAT